jgi:hypothetical protein
MGQGLYGKNTVKFRWAEIAETAERLCSRQFQAL